MSQPVLGSHCVTTRQSYIPVLDKKHLWQKKKISFKLPQKMTTSKPSRIPILCKSSGSQDHVTTLNTSDDDNRYNMQTSQVVVNNMITVDKEADHIVVQETSVRANELSSSLHTSEGKSIDSGFVNEKNKQTVDIQSLPFTCTALSVANTKDNSSHVEAKCFMPLEEVDQGIIQTASQGSLASTATSTSLEEMVGDECSSSGCDCVRMSQAANDWNISTQLHRPRSACDNYIIHHLVTDQNMRRHDSLPQLQSSPTLLASKINLLHNEKEALESELRLCKSRNLLAQSEIKTLQDKELQLKETVNSLKTSLGEVNDEMDKLKQSNFLEINQLKRHMSSEHDKLITELNAQIRQLTLEREEALAQVTSLHHSLSETQAELRKVGSKEHNSLATSATQAEVDSLQIELKALKAFTAEGESARAALQSNLTKLNKQISDLQKEKSDLLLQLEDSNAASTNVIVNELKRKVVMMEKQLSLASEDKSRAVAEIEQRMTAELVKQQLQSEDLRQALKQNEEIIDIQNKRMEQMEKQLSDVSLKPKRMKSPGTSKQTYSPEKKGTRKIQKDRSRSPSPRNISFSGPSSSFPSFGRWTAHRAYVKKHAEEMQTIMSSLAKEGFSPGHSSVDEVIRHLWWKRQHANSKLHLAEKTIKKMSGGDTKLALQEWKQSLSKLEAKIESGEEDNEQIQKRKEELEQAIERQLQDLILVKQQALDECKALKEKAEASDQRIFELEERNLSLENELSKSYKTSVTLQEKLEYATKRQEDNQSEFKLQQRQASLLKAEINTLKCQLDQQKQQLVLYYADRDKAIEKLDKTGVDMQQTKQHAIKLEAKVNQLENDLKATEQKYSIIQEHKITLEEQLEEIRMQKSNLESLLEKEKTYRQSIQQELDQLSMEYEQKVRILNDTSIRENKLNIEVLNLQKNLQMTQQHFTESETELSVTRIKSTELQHQLTQKENHCNQLSSEVSALSTELESSQNACSMLQSSLSNIQSKLGLNNKEIEILTVEKEELQTRLNSILNDLDFAHKKLEVSGKEKSEHVHLMAIKDQQLLEVEAEKSKAMSEVRESKAVIQNMQENLHKIVDEKNAEILKLKQDNLTTVGELTVAEKKIEITDRELAKLRSQLEESKDNFLKEKKSLIEKLLNTSEQIKQLNNELVMKDEILAGKESELLTCKSENSQLTNEVSLAKDKLKQANSSSEKLHSQLVIATKEIDAKTRHIETLDNDILVIRQHIENLNHEVKETFTDEQIDTVLRDNNEEENQIVKLLNTIQEEIQNVTKAKHDLEVEVSSLSEQKNSNERKLQKLEQEVYSLRSDLSQVTATKEELSNEANQWREKFKEVQTNSERMAKSQQDLQKICKDYEHKISEVKSRCLLLESQLGQKESALKIAESENSSLKSRIAMASTDLETTLATNRRLEKALSEMREASGQQQSKLMQEALEYKSTNKNLNMEMMSLKSQLTQASQSLENAKGQLREDKKLVTKLESDLQMAMKTSNGLSIQLQNSREECQMLTANMKSFNDTINSLKVENAQLQEKLKESMSKLSAAQRATSDTDKKFNAALMALQSRLEEEKVKAISEKQQLLADMTQIRNDSADWQRMLDQTQQELHQCQMTLERSDKMRSELETTLQSEIKYREDLQARYHNAENGKDILTAKLEQLKSELNVKEEKYKQVELQLQKAQKDYGGLLEQLQIQREAAAGSLNKLQQKSKEQITKLQTKIDNLTMELQGVQSKLKNTELSTKSLSSDNNLLTRETVELRNTCDVLKKKLREEESSLKLSQHKIEQLGVSLELEKQNRNKCQEEVNELQVIKSSLQSKLVVEKDNVSSIKAEKEALEEILNSERSLIVSLKSEVSQLKLQLKALNQEMEVEKQSHLSTSQNATKELLQLKEKFNEEKRGFRLKIKEANNRVLELESEIQKKELDLARVKDANYDLTEERVQLTTKLTETEKKSRERKEEIQKLKMHNHEIELQVSQLQLEINTLQQMQTEWEQYRKKLEASSRAEVQHVLAEVTEHMAQQHSAHKSLEKLRAENESLALKEKDRKIHHLKSELRQVKHDLKHDQMHIGNLELETTLLKSQKKEHERARKRLEAKLHSVNSTLTHSLKSPDRSYERPRTISTPHWNNSLSDINSL